MKYHGAISLRVSMTIINSSKLLTGESVAAYSPQLIQEEDKGSFLRFPEGIQYQLPLDPLCLVIFETKVIAEVAVKSFPYDMIVAVKSIKIVLPIGSHHFKIVPSHLRTLSH